MSPRKVFWPGRSHPDPGGPGCGPAPRCPEALLQQRRYETSKSGHEMALNWSADLPRLLVFCPPRDGLPFCAGRRGVFSYFDWSFFDFASSRGLLRMAGRPCSPLLGVDSGPGEGGSEGVRGAPEPNFASFAGNRSEMNNFRGKIRGRHPWARTLV